MLRTLSTGLQQHRSSWGRTTRRTAHNHILKDTLKATHVQTPKEGRYAPACASTARMHAYARARPCSRAHMPVGVLAVARARACPCNLCLRGARARARSRSCSRVSLQSVLARCACCTVNARPCSRAWTDVPVLTESLCVLHLQVNLARLLNGLGDTSLLDPDSPLGMTVRRSEQYDSLMLELRQEKEKNEQLRADLDKRSIDDRSLQVVATSCRLSDARIVCSDAAQCSRRPRCLYVAAPCTAHVRKPSTQRTVSCQHTGSICWHSCARSQRGTGGVARQE